MEQLLLNKGYSFRDYTELQPIRSFEYDSSPETGSVLDLSTTASPDVSTVESSSGEESTTVLNEESTAVLNSSLIRCP